MGVSGIEAPQVVYRPIIYIGASAITRTIKFLVFVTS